MKPALLPGLALAAALGLAACSGAASGPDSTTSPGVAPVDTSIAPPQTGEASPDAPDAPYPGGVTEADLPADSELVWTPEIGWRTVETSEGGGTQQLSVCQQNRMESLGAKFIMVRTYALAGDPNTSGADAAAIAMSFESKELADQAYATAQGWITECAATLEAQDRTEPRFAIEPMDVPVAGGRAQVSEWMYGTAADEGEFESQGLIQVGDRLELLVMRVQGQDNNFDTEPNGPVGLVHPMIRSVPAAAEKLAR
ncbi:hypothetical protein AADG42_12560 [Ammonicoccus fulvus]|uniref:PknH-like extracellular domain-containing protein n=1 Tax=Ammonicoccus fulvus TaxID=3138240 RepID=A0ABZ3FTQ9_9ACTN